MKKGLLCVAALVLSTAFVSTGFAQSPAGAPEKKAETPAPAQVKEVKKDAPKSDRMKARGEIVSVDQAAKTMVVKTKKGEMTFDVSSARFGRNYKLEEAKAGDRVRVTYKEVDGKAVARYVGKHRHPDLSDMLKARGEIVSVDQAAKTMVVKTKKGEVTFDVSSARFGKNYKLEEAKAGDRVGLVYKETDGKMVAGYVGKHRHPDLSDILKARGEIVSVDQAAKTMVVKTKKGEMTFDVSSAKAGRNFKLEEAKAGDRVAIGYTETDGKMVAKFVGKHRHYSKRADRKARPAPDAKPAEAAPTK